MLTCPRCESDCIYPSKRRGIFERRVLALAFLRPFRCSRCYHRFLGSLWSEPGGLVKPKKKASSSASASPQS
jgi:hypothetical protein